MDSNVDLNLLVALEVLLAERNVTRAARRLNLSQPALSAQLARLRALLGDPLLLPAQRGMVPTRRALELHGPLRDALEQVRGVLAAASSFDPAAVRATVSIAASDYGQVAVLLPLLKTLAVTAPGLTLAWRTLDAATLMTQMEKGDVDLAIMTPETAPDRLRIRHLFQECYVAILRSDHPAAERGLDLDTYCALDHVMVSPQGGGFIGPADTALSAIGRTRRVVLSAPGFLVVPEIIAASEMVALVPERIARLHEGRLRLFAPPVAVPGFTMAMVWHERTNAHPILHWLREQLLTMG